MQAIANLVHDDPYLKLTPEQRAVEVRDRRVRLFSSKPSRIEFNVAPSMTDPPMPKPVFSMQDWIDRQKENHKLAARQKILTEASAAAAARRPSIEQIQRACAAHYGVSRSDILSAGRTKDIVRPRQVAMYLAKTLAQRSLPEIGRRFGGRDHTTALHSFQKIGRLVEMDAALASDIETIKADIDARLA